MTDNKATFNAIVCKNFTYYKSEKLRDKNYHELLEYFKNSVQTGHCVDVSTEDFVAFEWIKDHIGPANMDEQQKRNYLLSKDFIVVFDRDSINWVELRRL